MDTRRSRIYSEAVTYLIASNMRPITCSAFTFMKTKTTLGILAVLTLLVGCATQPRGPAYGHEQEFRRQVEESVPVKDWGYRIELIRFSADYQKALVVVAVPAKTNVTEVVLEDDGFRRYKASVTDWARIERARPTIRPGTPEFAKSSLAAISSGKASICVTFPKTGGSAYQHETVFRRQLTNSVPVKDWGYKIQEIRFSSDFHKALVLCLEPGALKSREFTLVDDGFRRFSCPVTPHDAEDNLQFTNTVVVTVTLPDK